MRHNPIVVAVYLMLGGVFVSDAPFQVFGSETVGIGLTDKGWVQLLAGEPQPTPLPLHAATDPTQPKQPEQPTQPTQPGEPTKPQKPKPPKALRSQSGDDGTFSAYTTQAS